MLNFTPSQCNNYGHAQSQNTTKQASAAHKKDTTYGSSNTYIHAFHRSPLKHSLGLNVFFTGCCVRRSRRGGIIGGQIVYTIGVQNEKYSSQLTPGDNAFVSRLSHISRLLADTEIDLDTLQLNTVITTATIAT